MAEGIRARHGRKCRTHDGGRCNSKPTWEAFVYLKREKQKLRRSFPTEAAAMSWRADALSAANRGKLRAPTRITLQEAAAEWLELVEAGRHGTRSGDAYKPSTLRGYWRDLEQRILPALGPVPLSEIRRADVQALADELTAGGASASSVQNCLDPLRVILGRAIRRDMIAVDPTEGFELRRPRGRRDRIADPAEAATLLAALPDSERALWTCAFYGGLRRGELRGLQWADIDLDAREIHVRCGWDDEQGEIPGKSQAADRTVPIVDALAAELAALKLRTSRRDDDLVFGRSATEAFYPSTVRSRALKAWTAAGLTPIGLHEARHTCASLLIASGCDPKTLT